MSADRLRQQGELRQALGDTEITANNAASRFVSMNGTHTVKVGYFDQSSHYEKQVEQESGTKGTTD